MPTTIAPHMLPCVKCGNRSITLKLSSISLTNQPHHNTYRFHCSKCHHGVDQQFYKTVNEAAYIWNGWNIETTQLVNCSFCGHNEFLFYRAPNNHYGIICPKCQAQPPAEHRLGATIAEAGRYWNIYHLRLEPVVKQQ